MRRPCLAPLSLLALVALVAGCAVGAETKTTSKVVRGAEGETVPVACVDAFEGAACDATFLAGTTYFFACETTIDDDATCRARLLCTNGTWTTDTKAGAGAAGCNTFAACKPAGNEGYCYAAAGGLCFGEMDKLVCDGPTQTKDGPFALSVPQLGAPCSPEDTKTTDCGLGGGVRVCKGAIWVLDDTNACP